MQMALEGGDKENLPVFSVYNKDKGYMDLYNSGNGAVYWSAKLSNDWIKLSETSGVVYDESRVWVSIDWDKAPTGISEPGDIQISWSSSVRAEWMDWDQMSEAAREAYVNGDLNYKGPNPIIEVNLSLFNPASPAPGDVKGFVESNGYISIEAENFSRKTEKSDAEWTIIEGLGRSGNSLTVLPPTVSSIEDKKDIVSKSPVLEYDMYTFTSGVVDIQLNCSPSNPINGDYGLRIAVAVDEGEPRILSYERGNKDVMTNLMSLHGNIDLKTSGEHTLKIFMVDPGVILDKIIIDTGGVKESYLGPPESYSNR